MRICIECGAVISNPRFCNRSCAAKYNNKIAPKRAPEGKCKDCGGAVSTSITYCLTCKEKQAVARERIEKNIQAIDTRGGIIERALPKAFSSKTVEFDTLGVSFEKTGKTLCGELLDYLMGLAKDCPEYLRPGHKKWVLSLLQDFYDFEYIMSPFGAVKERRKKVSGLPLHYLEESLRDWVHGYLSAENSTLVAIYALGVCEFIEAHCFGGYRGCFPGERWRINGMFPKEFIQKHFPEKSFRFLQNATFKRYFTDCISGVVAVAEVPVGGKIEFSAKEIPSLKPGDKFYFKIERCHLSSGFSDYDRYKVIEDGRPAFDFFDDLRIRGSIYKNTDDDKSVVRGSGVEGRLPVCWLTHILPQSQSEQAEPWPSGCRLILGDYNIAFSSE